MSKIHVALDYKMIQQFNSRDETFLSLFSEKCIHKMKRQSVQTIIGEKGTEEILNPNFQLRIERSSFSLDDILSKASYLLSCTRKNVRVQRRLCFIRGIWHLLFAPWKSNEEHGAFARDPTSFWKILLSEYHSVICNNRTASIKG